MEFERDTYIACMCEGGAEDAIINILLDHELLCFSRSQLLDEDKLIRRCKVREFEKLYLRQAYDKKITVIRVLDSKGEKFRLNRAYQHQVDKVIDIITAPEIEILLIIAAGKYQDYSKRSSDMKPSVYCKQFLKMKKVKKPAFVFDYFSDIEKLLNAIKEYDRLHKKRDGELSLADLLKNKP